MPKNYIFKCKYAPNSGSNYPSAPPGANQQFLDINTSLSNLRLSDDTRQFVHPAPGGAAPGIPQLKD